MQDCGQVRRMVRTRSRKKAGVELDITESVAVCGTSGKYVFFFTDINE